MVVNSIDSSSSRRSIFSTPLTMPLRFTTSISQQLLATEGEELTRQRGGAFRRRDDFPDAVVARTPSVDAPSSALPRITVSRLLKSCATPPASRPTVSIFCDCCSCALQPLAVGHVAPDEQMTVRHDARLEAELDGAFPSAGRRDEFALVLAALPACVPRPRASPRPTAVTGNGRVATTAGGHRDTSSSAHAAGLASRHGARRRRATARRVRNRRRPGIADRARAGRFPSAAAASAVRAECCDWSFICCRWTTCSLIPSDPRPHARNTAATE